VSCADLPSKVRGEDEDQDQRTKDQRPKQKTKDKTKDQRRLPGVVLVFGVLVLLVLSCFSAGVSTKKTWLVLGKIFENILDKMDPMGEKLIPISNPSFLFSDSLPGLPSFLRSC
jgi:hypothetical protein